MHIFSCKFENNKLKCKILVEKFWEIIHIFNLLITIDFDYENIDIIFGKNLVSDLLISYNDNHYNYNIN